VLFRVLGIEALGERSSVVGRVGSESFSTDAGIAIMIEDVGEA
jgi:hypothetical protein